MADIVIAQAPPPAPGQIGPLPVLPFPMDVTVGESRTGDVTFSGRTGQICLTPLNTKMDKTMSFFARCPPEKFLDPAHPECSCGAYRATVEDFGMLRIKSGESYYAISGAGANYPFVMGLMLLFAMIIICSPFVYWMSYRMSRKELEASQREHFFFEWHKQRMSSLICMMMVAFGFALFLNGAIGGSKIAFGGLNVETSAPGIIFALLGFGIWFLVLKRTPYRQRTRPPV